ncbi:uncharacterized protein L969DRAFT_94402 [Mixia osmundae IAM 14324]|uniref:Uncharacterized protein n=1 Tax=Mixia osmundae (strain CBS 9802 / IAM 14324 / JCM 22182 / KY 12970) TaxID=764103 RepID=G7E3D3_MIXOS|nr:uncharacterized protein L969DRAFT_94402 [Mixia osmundae IAM 14324]KEI39329.1 hypothetical protein L969DRAFT_94402 [Mixia osmundae IAM 14324]GAA97343.1 hypothetical protein E5Q_04021 [Mixia osmundae IAM 14324]
MQTPPLSLSPMAGQGLRRRSSVDATQLPIKREQSPSIPDANEETQLALSRSMKRKTSGFSPSLSRIPSQAGFVSPASPAPASAYSASSSQSNSEPASPLEHLPMALTSMLREACSAVERMLLFLEDAEL